MRSGFENFRAGFNRKKTNGIIILLKAIVDGETIIGPDLTKEEWTTLNLLESS